jgi:hypothetical protein
MAHFGAPGGEPCGVCDRCSFKPEVPMYASGNSSPGSLLEPLPSDLRWRLDEASEFEA